MNKSLEVNITIIQDPFQEDVYIVKLNTYKDGDSVVVSGKEPFKKVMGKLTEMRTNPFERNI